MLEAALIPGGGYMTEYSWAEETNARINRYKFREDN
ncbi:hypothetical protein RUMTOR_01399 [[Ruminococcus] torques ATCC 27756]|uniref:Uncharacterized protein n=1 Tax=[Ruminococcus] torques ATCC 27756 TaxID=411460 RepID=A5KMC8_9FIRM|nr:hypothetical protein RUMTOR_01399 [[Ruminococcus] torques ATCC 27756]